MIKTSTTTSLAEASGSFTILIVDDNRDLVDFVKLLLSHQGFNVRWAFNGPECLEIIRNSVIDLVILDVMMPKMDGIEVCKELKSLVPSLPIIFLTAKDDLTTRTAAMNMGVSEFLAKPVNIDDFLDRVRTQLSVRQWVRNVDAVFISPSNESDLPAIKDKG